MTTEEFFLVAPPGLEPSVASELKRWAPDVKAEAIAGGVRLSAPRPVGFGLNLALKTPTRILWRIAHFRVRDFPKLYQKVRALPWDEWLEADVGLEVQAASRRSRLKIKERIAITCADAVASVRGKVDAKRTLTLYVRVQDDECTLSLDTSGERLHKRGARTHIGEAPLRETLAASLIELVASIEGSASPREVFDPMVGSGTFLLEAAGRFELADKREFAFGLIKESHFEAPRAPEEFRPKLLGWDRDEATLATARRNLKHAGLEAALDKRDIFGAEPLPKEDARWAFVNPPYGERLKIKGSLAEYYARLIPKVLDVAKPKRACFLLAAAGFKGKFPMPFGYRALAKVKLSNGGIPVVAFVVGL